MIREIVTYDIHRKDNPEVLTNKTRKVKDFHAEETVECITDLNDTLDELIRKEGNKRGAIGLSATQIGIDLAISAVTLGNQRYILINPVLIEEKGKQRLFRIGCFSLYEYRAMVRYNDDIVIAYYDPQGNRQKLALKGDQSCVVQHEMDHLIGDLLFERLENKEKDLFIPREAMYRDGSVPIENHGDIFESLRSKGFTKVISPAVWYGSLFNDYTDYFAYVEKTANEYTYLLDLVRRYTPEKGRIIEAGNGTSALSVALSRNGYEVLYCGSDADMLELAKRINETNGTSVSYQQNDIYRLPYDDEHADTVFSYEVLETLNNAELASALEEGLRVANAYVFLVPTIAIVANTLRGNERLRSVDEWIAFIEKEGHRIKEYKEFDNGGYVIFVIA
ncbi:MAG: peptide deformylase [Erysipelotrichaceae bacterium]|nr:peptide deformylase [Erysipelotrichaceae bacterium]